jgi:hypothetical protein
MLVPAAAAAAPRVLVWPQHPAVDTSDAEKEVKAAGLTVIDVQPVRDRLHDAASQARGAETDVLTELEQDLVRAREAYLQQRWDGVLERLSLGRPGRLAAVSRAETCGTLWEVQFQRGLALIARKEPGDDVRAREAFESALSLDPDRRPAKEIYGPAAFETFALAAAEIDRRVARHVSIDVMPPDAIVTVDCKPVVDHRRGARLLAGAHVVRVSAPGYATRAELVTITDQPTVTIVLQPMDGDAFAKAGPAWSEGTLVPGARSGRNAIFSVATEVGADTILVVDEDENSHAIARLITREEISSPIARTNVRDAARSALALLDPATGALREPLDAGAGRERGVTSTWWFWTGVGAAVVGVVVLSIVLADGPEDRTIVEVGDYGP